MKLCLLISDSRYTYTVHDRGYSVVADLFPVRERELYEHAVSHFTVLYCTTNVDAICVSTSQSHRVR